MKHLIPILAVLSSAAPALAQPYSIEWFTIDGGGGQASDGNSLTVDYTIGQPDVAVMSDGRYSVSGGFWYPGILGTPCDPDLNQDGNTDQGDLDYLVNAIAGGGNPNNVDLDFNHDGNEDQGDLDALINAIAGGGCP